MKKTKIICTIGPKSENKPMMAKLLAAGMNVMRLNFSHGDYWEHGGRMINLRALMAETGKICAILLDTKDQKSEPKTWKMMKKLLWKQVKSSF